MPGWLLTLAGGSTAQSAVLCDAAVRRVAQGARLTPRSDNDIVDCWYDATKRRLTAQHMSGSKRFPASILEQDADGYGSSLFSSKP